MPSAARIHRRSVMSRNYEREVLSDGPVFLWMLDETSGTTAQDSTLSNNDGTYSGSFTLAETSIIPTTTRTSCDFAPALVTSPTLPSVTEFTFECVLVADSLTGSHGLVQRDDNISDRYFYVACVGADLYFSAHDPSLVQNEIGPITLTTATAYHLAVTRNASEQVIYLNGVAVLTDVVATGARTGTTQLILLGDYDGDGWDGNLQGVAYHASALPANRILAHAVAAGLA